MNFAQKAKHYTIKTVQTSTDDKTAPGFQIRVSPDLRHKHTFKYKVVITAA